MGDAGRGALVQEQDLQVAGQSDAPVLQQLARWPGKTPLGQAQLRQQAQLQFGLSRQISVLVGLRDQAMVRVPFFFCHR